MCVFVLESHEFRFTNAEPEDQGRAEIIPGGQGVPRRKYKKSVI